MTFFDVRISGLKMTVVAADGPNVVPVPVDEFRIGVAEVYDVIVEPKEDHAYTIFAEAMDRSGYARGTLAPREGMSGPIPELRPIPERSMADMGMDMHMHGGGSHGAMKMSGTGSHDTLSHGDMSHGGMSHEGMSHNMRGMNLSSGASSERVMHGPDHHGPSADMVAMQPKNRLGEPGTGLEDAKHRVLVYTDLRSPKPYPDQRTPGREIEIHLTGNMERFMWSFDGKKFSEAKEPIRFKHGERLRLTMVNDTMMEHPIHLHGMWMYLDNGTGAHKPRKHTINVKPGERLSVEITADAPGDWAFHCHLLYHMEAGMFRVVSVSEA
jgi:CopA family copper-resistance protein